MKTLEELKKERDMLIAAPKSILTEKEYNKNSKRVSFLNECIFYLEKEPRKEFVEKMLEDTRSKIVSLNNGFSMWCASNPQYKDKAEKERWQIFYAEVRMKDLNRHLKYLTYILNEPAKSVAA